MNHDKIGEKQMTDEEIEAIIKSKLEGKDISSEFIQIIVAGMIGKARLFEMSKDEISEQIENIARGLKFIHFKEYDNEKQIGRFYLNGECFINTKSIYKFLIKDRISLEDIALVTIDAIIHEIDMHCAECRKDGSMGTYIYNGNRFGKALDEGVVSCSVSKLLHRHDEKLIYKNLRHRSFCSNDTCYCSYIWNGR